MNKDPEETTKTQKLFVAKIPLDADKPKFVAACAKFGQILDAFLSPPSKDGDKNGGWGVLVATPKVAAILLHETVMIGEQIIRITPFVGKQTW